VTLPPAPEPEQTLRDYASVGLTLRRHPVSFVRERLAAAGAIPARELADAARSPQGRAVRVAGLALVRQRPATASGIVFITIEDESGVANLIVRPRTFERYRKAARLSACMLAEGRVERQGQVVHIQVERLASLDGWLEGLSARSRDFH
jgi:error-prone DNA polymerase